jgi:hypothetical protein
MSIRKVLKCLTILLLVCSGSWALAQGITNAALRGHIESEGAGLPGVTVSLTSPALQGVRTTVTSANGDYAFVALPPGDYTVTFKLQGFQTVIKKDVSLTTAQQSTVDAKMAVAGVTAETTVVAKAETIPSGIQGASTYSAEITNKLPVARTLLSAVALSPGTAQSGPNNSFVISGAPSYDNQFTVDGAVIMDNVRNTPNNLFVEDAIQETTTSTSSVSAEFGRFTGGIVNTVTRTGGNSFSGSFRTTLTNDAWTAISPARESRVQKVNPRYEATLGGPFWKDHIWFFGSGRFANVTGSNQTSFTAIPFETGDDEKRYQGKLTLTPIQNHSITANYLKVTREQKGNFFGVIMDLDSLVTRQLPQDILTVNYNGVLSSTFFVEGLYSNRHFTFENSGSTFTDLIKGTIMRDLSRGNARYNSPTFCGVCDPEERNNRDFLIKGTYFLSTEKLGSHNIVVGYDNFSGTRKANNYQSGSNYRLFTTSAIFQGGDIFPVIGSNSIIYYTPIDSLSKGTDTLTHSVFVNDSLRLSDRLSFNIGVRWDKNNAKDSRGVVTANDNAFSPRLAAAYDVLGNGKLKVAASYARYVGAIQDNLVDSSSNAGAPSLFYWYYDGPGATPINVNPAPGATLATRAQALQQVFDWFFAQGCPNLSTCQLPLAYAAVAGVSTQIRETLKSPHANEYSIGVSGQIGNSGAFRVDFVRREWADFYSTVLDTSTGQVSDSLGNTFDLGIVGNSSAYTRNYTGLHTSFQYRVGQRVNIGGSWTWSHTLGDFVGETYNNGPGSGQNTVYPEYKDPVWNNPKGDLPTDQRHRARLFASWDLPFIPERLGVLNISAIQSYDTGVPYGAVGAVRSRLYVTNPGYVTPPSSVNYYYTARDAFRTDTVKATDLALNFSTKIAGLVELFIQPKIYNLFNNRGGLPTNTSSGDLAVNATVRTAVSSGGGANTFLNFNPFTTTPVQRPHNDTTVKDANWDFGPTFGQPRNVRDYQTPRQFEVSVGLRF